MVGSLLVGLLLGAAAEPAAPEHTRAAPRASAAAPADPHAHLRRILEDPLFSRWQRRVPRVPAREPAGPRREGWRWRLGQWIDQLIEWIFGRRAWTPGPGPGQAGTAARTLIRLLAWAAVALLLLLVVLSLVRLARTGRPSARGTDVSRRDLGEALRAGAALAAEPRQWIEEADRRLEQADLRLAVRAAYLALLSHLHATGRIDFRASRTNWACIAGFRGPPEQARRLADTTRRFDEAWYGLRQPDPAVFDAMRSDVERMLQEGGHDG